MFYVIQGQIKGVLINKIVRIKSVLYSPLHVWVNGQWWADWSHSHDSEGFSSPWKMEFLGHDEVRRATLPGQKHLCTQFYVVQPTSSCREGEHSSPLLQGICNMFAAKLNKIKTKKQFA